MWNAEQYLRFGGQRWENGPYFAAFSSHIPDMRVESGKICPRSSAVSLSNN